jgi:hypothetical protein
MARLLAILTITALAAAGWFVGGRLVFSAPDDAHWIEQLYSAKERALQRIEGPRVILVGGSSAYYSFSAAQLSRRLGLPVVNFGTHAGLGARYLLDRAARNMKSGDVVVLTIETGLIKEARPTAELTRFVQFYDPGYVQRAGARSWAPLLVGALPHDLFRSSVAELLLGPTKTHIDAAGDATDNLAGKVSPEIRAIVAGAKLVSIETRPDDPPQYLMRFVASARQRGVTVLAAWSPMLDRPPYHDRSDPQRFTAISSTYDVLKVPVLGKAQDFLFPLADMYNSGFHLNDVGRVQATARLGDLICRRIRCAAGAGEAGAQAL